MKNPIREMVIKRQLGIHSGIPSFCTASKIVIEAILEQAKRFDDYALIEATSNQVNQFGGYTNMTSKDFVDYVYHIADRINFPREKVLLGGDHLGPLAWADRPAAEAMENAKELVRQAVLAGCTKIHLDTSMRLGDDPTDQRLSDEVIAERGAVLYKVCEEAFQERLKEHPDSLQPVYVIGSEVPVPGGNQEDEDTVEVTDPDDFENTLITYRKKFKELGLENAWQNIIAVVVQPGVEFGNDEIHVYNRVDSYKLCKRLANYPDIVFEGHSTDFQPPHKLKEMVEDGIAIIKVGPALTFALREGLFALSMMEKELIKDESKRANFIELLDRIMVENPKEWQKYYHGDELQKELARKYSFSDRSRYYMARSEIEAAINKLFENINSYDIPLGMIKQYMPSAFAKIREGKLSKDARELVKSNIVDMVEDYNFAVKYNYMTSGAFR